MIPMFRVRASGTCRATVCLRSRFYHLKWLKARLASAILCVSSRRLTAAPRPFMASTSSAASFSLMLLPFRLRAAWTSQRTPSDMRRSPRISTGTWYVAPPTRRGLTSMIGVALRIAAARISRPGRAAWASARASAWRRIRSARFCLPPFISVAEKRAVRRLAGLVSYFDLRGMLVRRGMSAGPRFRGGLRAVLAATLLAVAHAGRVERAADDVVLDRRQVLDPAAADKHDRVLLQVVPDARDVGRDLHLVGQPHAGDLAQRGVRLLRRHRSNLEADPTLLGGARDRHLALPQAVPVLAHRRRLDLRDLALAAVAYELADRRHEDATPWLVGQVGWSLATGRSGVVVGLPASDGPGS